MDNSIGVLVTILFVVWVIDKFFIKGTEKKTRSYSKPNIKIHNQTTTGKNNGRYGDSYVKTTLLTKREQSEYRILKIAADAKNLQICPKVRMLDLVVPKYNAKNSKALMAKVMSKHVDFVICNQDMEVVCIIELDDSTHQRKDRIERDLFVDSVLTGAGYKVIHTYQINLGILDFYNSSVQPLPDHRNKIQNNKK